MTNPSVPNLHFDGTFIDVLWDHHDEAISWYKKFMGWDVKQAENWKPDPRCEQGRMTSMNWGVWLVSSLSSVRLPHHFAERGTVDSNVRLCWRTRGLKEVHERFKSSSVRVSDIYDEPGNVKYFDFWATFEGAKQTAQEDNQLPQDGFVPSWNRIAVSNLEQSIQWYSRHLGMQLEQDYSSEGYVIMSLKLNHHPNEKSLWVLEKAPEGAYIGKVDGLVQPVCWIHARDDFFGYHSYLSQNAIEVSEIGGFLTRGVVSFHFYDPDGNRLNISSM